MAVSWVASGGSGCLGHPTPGPWGLQPPLLGRQPLPDTSGGGRLHPHPRLRGRTPDAPGQPPRWPHLGRSHSHSPRRGPRPALPGCTLQSTHPLATAEPSPAKPGARAVWTRGAEGAGGLGGGGGAAGPGWDSQRLQARQLPQRLGGDTSQLVVLQHPARRGGAWRTRGRRSGRLPAPHPRGSSLSPHLQRPRGSRPSPAHGQGCPRLWGARRGHGRVRQRQRGGRQRSKETYGQH